MTVTTDALIPALEDAREAHAAVIDRFQSDLAVTPAGEHRQLLERHAATVQDHIAGLDDHVRDIRPRHLLRYAGDLVRTASAGAFHAALLPMQIGTRVMRGILPSSQQPIEQQLLKNTEDQYITTARALGACRAGESIATLARDEQAATLLAALRRQDEQFLEALESSVEEQTLAVATAAATDGGHLTPDMGALTGAATRTLRTAIGLLGQAVRGGGRQTAPTAAQTAPETVTVTRIAEVVREEDLSIPRYGRLSVATIIERLRTVSQTDLAIIEAYERAHADRVEILNAIENLRGYPSGPTTTP
jgi:hypothetical protein